LAREYVSIEWNGYLNPKATGTFNFYAEVDDGIKVWVD
jgi:hypothetical protein